MAPVWKLNEREPFCTRDGAGLGLAALRLPRQSTSVPDPAQLGRVGEDFVLNWHAYNVTQPDLLHVIKAMTAMARTYTPSPAYFHALATCIPATWDTTLSTSSIDTMAVLTTLLRHLAAHVYVTQPGLVAMLEPYLVKAAPRALAHQVTSALYNITHLAGVDPPSKDLLRELYRRLDRIAARDTISADNRRALCRAAEHAVTLQHIYPPSALLLRAARDAVRGTGGGPAGPAGSPGREPVRAVGGPGRGPTGAAGAQAEVPVQTADSPGGGAPGVGELLWGGVGADQWCGAVGALAQKGGG